MKAALFYGGTDIRVEELAPVEPGEGEVLVRVRSAGICGSDLHHYRSEAPWQRPAGSQDGHELAGEIAALGPGVTGLTVGQRVGIEPQHLIGCGRCPRCRNGETHLCASRGRHAGRLLRSHGFSQYDVCLASQVHSLPDGLPLDAAAILDCYACGVHALHRASLAPCRTAVVIGTGAIGMTLGQVARAGGARRVLMTGNRPEPLAVAERAGAADEGLTTAGGDVVAGVMERTGGAGADVVFETVGGSGPTLRHAVEMARPGGTVCVLGVFTRQPGFDVRVAYGKELTILWSNSYSTWDGVSEYEIALDLLAEGKVRAEPLITHHFVLDDIGAAFAAAADKRSSGAIKVLVHP
jgi:threonine dehydrogenase-like Zn-dependent dehydrogenase